VGHRLLSFGGCHGGGDGGCSGDFCPCVHRCQGIRAKFQIPPLRLNALETGFGTSDCLPSLSGFSRGQGLLRLGCGARCGMASQSTLCRWVLRQRGVKLIYHWLQRLAYCRSRRASFLTSSDLRTNDKRWTVERCSCRRSLADGTGYQLCQFGLA